MRDDDGAVVGLDVIGRDMGTLAMLPERLDEAGREFSLMPSRRRKVRAHVGEPMVPTFSGLLHLEPQVLGSSVTLNLIPSRILVNEVFCLAALFEDGRRVRRFGD